LSRGGLKKGHFDDAPHISDRQQRADQNQYRHPPLTTFKRSQHQIPLTNKTDRERYANEAQASDDNGGKGPGHTTPETRELTDVRRAELVHNTAQCKEEPAFH
jgi:hypothetical protein